MSSSVVISGISGRFPECENVSQLRHHLLANNDLITEDERRWPSGLYGLPIRSGKLRTLSKFDNQYFGVTPLQTQSMDPQQRIALEIAHECIVDAGIDCKIISRVMNPVESDS